MKFGTRTRHVIQHAVIHVNEAVVMAKEWRIIGVHESPAGTHFVVLDGIVTFVRPRPGKLFFYKTRARPQQIYS